jgi:hypothetical protein
MLSDRMNPVIDQQKEDHAAEDHRNNNHREKSYADSGPEIHIRSFFHTSG